MSFLGGGRGGYGKVRKKGKNPEDFPLWTRPWVGGGGGVPNRPNTAVQGRPTGPIGNPAGFLCPLRGLFKKHQFFRGGPPKKIFDPGGFFDPPLAGGSKGGTGRPPTVRISLAGYPTPHA